MHNSHDPHLLSSNSGYSFEESKIWRCTSWHDIASSPSLTEHTLEKISQPRNGAKSLHAKIGHTYPAFQTSSTLVATQSLTSLVDIFRPVSIPRGRSEQP